MAELARGMPTDAIIVDDAISSKDALHGAVEFNETDSIYGERIGAIGWGMGGVMGVKLAHPERPVIAVVGDGSAMMTVQALWTAANENIPVVYPDLQQPLLPGAQGQYGHLQDTGAWRTETGRVHRHGLSPCP